MVGSEGPSLGIPINMLAIAKTSSPRREVWEISMEAATTLEQLASLVAAKKASSSLLVGIDGFDGTGRTTLAFYLAQKLAGIRVGLDSYIDKDREAERFVGKLRLEDLARDLSGLLGCFPYVVVDGVCLAEALEAISTAVNQTIYIKRLSSQGLWHEGFHLEDFVVRAQAGTWLERSVYSYHELYQPHIRATICYSWTAA